MIYKNNNADPEVNNNNNNNSSNYIDMQPLRNVFCVPGCPVKQANSGI